MTSPSTNPALASLLPSLRDLGYDQLRPHQEEVLTHVLAGRDCVAVLPTGSGKTLCYGLPAQARPGLVLVLSPLIALIRDQARLHREWHCLRSLG